MRCLLDTNVILRGLDRNHPMYRVVRHAIISLRRQDNQLYLTSQNLIEFWSVATRPVDSNGLGMSVQWAAAQLTRMKTFFLVLADSPEVFREWERLVIEQHVSGKKVHDARLKLATVAIEDGDLVSRHETQDTDEVVRLL